MTRAIFTLATAITLCTATAADTAEKQKPKPSQEIVVADVRGVTEQAGHDKSVEELKAIFRKRLSTISRWSQLR